MLAEEAAKRKRHVLAEPQRDGSNILPPSQDSNFYLTNAPPLRRLYHNVQQNPKIFPKMKPQL